MNWVALLRGVNVGGRVVRMAELRDALQAFGLEDVATILQSGNVRFVSEASAAALQARIEAKLRERFGYDAHVQVLERDRLRKIVDAYPFGAAEDTRHDYVIFMERGLETALAAENVELGDNERVAVGDGVVYWRVDKGSTLRSSFGKLLTRASYRDANTNRNLRTLRKLTSS
jgi:uncharacterized protein (DUF1697 family)